MPSILVGQPPSFNSCAQILRNAAQNAGKLAKGAELDSEDIADYMNRLNNLCNYWQIKGLKLWLQLDVSVQLVDSKPNPYRIYPAGDVVMTKPMRVIYGLYQDADDNRRPLVPLSKQEYNSLSDVAQTGPVNSYYADKQASSIDIYFWQVPDALAATGQVIMTVQQQVTNVVTLNDEMNFPQEWFIALQWGLADEISTGQPQAIMDRCAQKAKEYREALEDWDIEDASTSFQPDQRAQTVSRFR